jgi:hypothetical protein
MTRFVLPDPRREGRAVARLTAYFLLVALALYLTACASSTGFIVSGESLDAAGRSFVAVGQAYNAGLDAKTVTVEQYRAWATFARKFQQAYPPAVQLWKSSVAVNDAALQKDSAALIASLVTELATLGTAIGVQVLK